MPPSGMHSMGKDFRIDMMEKESVEVDGKNLGWDEPPEPTEETEMEERERYLRETMMDDVDLSDLDSDS